MARLPLEVREATPSDAPGLIALWRHCVAAAAEPSGDGAFTGQMWEEPELDEACAALSAGMGSATRRLYVALSGDKVLGAIQVEVAPASPLHLRRTVVVSELHVDPRARRRGVAWTLMEVAADWAEQIDAEHVFAWAPSASRDAHRFLTRIGFGHFATVRIARVRVLRARSAARIGASRGTGRLIAVRRSLRRTTEALARSSARD